MTDQTLPEQLRHTAALGIMTPGWIDLLREAASRIEALERDLDLATMTSADAIEATLYQRIPNGLTDAVGRREVAEAAVRRIQHDLRTVGLTDEERGPMMPMAETAFTITTDDPQPEPGRTVRLEMANAAWYCSGGEDRDHAMQTVPGDRACPLCERTQDEVRRDAAAWRAAWRAKWIEDPEPGEYGDTPWPGDPAPFEVYARPNATGAEVGVYRHGRLVEQRGVYTLGDCIGLGNTLTSRLVNEATATPEAMSDYLARRDGEEVQF
jgi:hypothetical protein